LGPRVNSYVAELAEYHIALIYRPGAVNRADELSRRPDLAPTDDDELMLVLPNHLFVPPETPSTAYVATRTKAENYDSDDTLVNSNSENPPLSIKAAATHDTVSPVLLDRQVIFSQKSGARTIRRWRTAHSLSQTGELWSKDGALVVVGNNELNRGLISLFHDSPTAGHPGITKTLALMKPYYWWPGMKGHITEYIKGCATCHRHLKEPACVLERKLENAARAWRTRLGLYALELACWDAWESLGVVEIARATKMSF